MPAVSIIIPSYNNEKYIGETIESVLQQSYQDRELIVVDDGSSDRTREIVRSYGSSVQLIEQSNAGVCRARNHGLSIARGRYICFMDHDDYWFPEKLARQIEAFEEQPEAGVVYSSFINWFAGKDDQFPRADGFDRSEILDDIHIEYSGWIYHHFLLDCWMLTSTAMIRAETLEECGGFDEMLPYAEDWDLWLRISRKYQILKLRKPTTLYRQHGQQGNRIIRDIDYRTRLLSQAVEKWGLCSNDGRCTHRRQFLGQLARYHASFARSHLHAGNLGVSFRSFWRAWCCSPANLKYLLYIPAALLVSTRFTVNRFCENFKSKQR